MNIWSAKSQPELSTNRLSGKSGADHRPAEPDDRESHTPDPGTDNLWSPTVTTRQNARRTISAGLGGQHGFDAHPLRRADQAAVCAKVVRICRRADVLLLARSASVTGHRHDRRVQTSEDPEFYVVGEPEETELGVVLRGRLFTGPLKLGDVFTTCEGPRAQANLPSDRRQEVQLEVVEIRLFRRLVHELDATFSAELLLAGEGWNAVRDGVVLHTRS
jgi:hypothetical protein